jgi:methenyltetrahydromethanopterin cyclohydrolase
MDLKLNKKASTLLSRCMGLADIDILEYVIDGRTASILDLGDSTEVNRETAKKAAVYAAESSLGGLGKVEKRGSIISVEIPEHPAIATLGCQLAGWAIDIGGKHKLGSGPARILARKPGKIIDKIGYVESSDEAALVLETDTLPDKETCKLILDATGAQKLTVAAFRDSSYIGLINVLARIVEVGVFRLNNLGYDTRKIVSAHGTVPAPALDQDVMYTANDAIIYKGKVSLETTEWDPKITEKAVSKSSASYGKAFKDICSEAGGDFYKIDPAIFAPAALVVKDDAGKKTFTAGRATSSI